MKTEESDPDNFLTVDVPERGRFLRSPLTWAIVAGIIGVSLAVWYFWPQQTYVPHTNTNAQYQAARSDAAKLRNAKQYDQAADKLETFAGQTKDKQLKIDALTEAASMYASQGNCAKAIEKYKAIEEMNDGKTGAEAVGIAGCAQELKDYDTAILYYQKAIDALDKKSPLYNAQKQGYERLIEQMKQLKGQS